MDPRIERFARRLVELTSPTVTSWDLDPSVDGLIELTAPAKVQAELIRFRRPGSKLLVVLFGDTVPAFTKREGFTLEVARNHASWTRPGEEILAARESDGRVCEWHCDAAHIEPSDAHRIVASIPLLEPFEALARPGALVRAIGIERANDGTLRARVTVDRDLERAEQDEAELAARGFAEPSDDDGLWVDGQGRSLVWMGATVYGYYGAVPDPIGGL